ncbi:phytanoyl-CoA dioxygenase family protein [Nocardiopsis mangrovi]|uniref:Phytanoyl-CoA dioxygenase family protein n=1 Tax=Nocardiopsis mangrovi TaxID=1179818 RepID=A0ABV9DTQ0_9ACTN
MSNPAEITTPENLPAEWIQRYRDEGYLHIPRILTDDEVDQCFVAAEKLIAERESEDWDASVDDHVSEGTVMNWVAGADLHSTALRMLALHPRVTGIAELLTGRTMRMFRSEVVRKPSRKSSVTPPHIDEPYWPWKGGVSMTAWVALVDVPVERGCMSFVPGSNLMSPPPAAEDWAIFETRPELAWRPRVTVPVRAGGCTFHNERVAHMAGANQTDMDRLSLGTVYIDAETRFAPEEGYCEEELGFEPGDLVAGDLYPVVGRAAT